ncbi:unnamed protein product [Aphanomyces euteiches]|nr:hypothetical protein AeRB84_020088 [Aphanomyces euteiches]
MEELTIRRAQASDAAKVGELHAPEKTVQKILYGRSHVNVLIETSYLALTAENATGDIVGFLSVNDLAPGDLVEDARYLDYVCDRYALENFPTNNATPSRFKAHTTLFMTYFVHSPAVPMTHILGEMLSMIFNLLLSIEWIAFPVHNSLQDHELAPFMHHFKQASVLNAGTKKQYGEELFIEFDVLVATSAAFLPSLTIRKANIEDHDDLEPILRQQNESLVNSFGEYFLAELIGTQTAHNMCLVAEASPASSRAVGIMALSDDVDLGTLRDCFDLSMYNNLVKPSSMSGPGSSARLEKILKRRKSPKMIMLGPPCSGKTTQVEKLVSQYGLVHLTVSVLLRVASRMNNAMGKKIKRHLDKHEEVPDDIVLTLVAERTHESDCITQGWVLDGYPTMEAQAQSMVQRGIKPDVVVLVEVPDDEVAQRLAKVSGGLDTKPRLEKYHNHIQAILHTFGRDQAVIRLDGKKDKALVTYALFQALSTSDRTKMNRPKTNHVNGPPTFVICGPPAGGKGTQCELLVKQYGVVHLSTGDMLRAAIKAGSELGLQAQGYMNAGALVPDDLIIRVVLERLKEDDCQTHGWLLDGFPRTEVQAQTMVVQGIVPQMVIVLDVPDDEVIKRISGRRVDVDTGRTYHLIYNPPPPELKDKVVQRADDTEETIEVRLGHYHTNCGAIVKTFTQTSIVLPVDGMQPKETISQAIASALAKSTPSSDVVASPDEPTPAKGPPKIIICGPPAGGKGTQCELLVKHYGVVHLSTGDILRAAIQAGSDVGLKAKGFMDAGELVPDDLIIRVIMERLDQPDCQKHGWLLDGFPRTEVQAQAMLGLSIIPHLVIVLDVPGEEVIKRISGRRVDLATGKTYHLVFNPPPPELADKVVQRSDDTEETIKVRLAKYNENCDAVVKSFAKTSRVLHVDGMQGKDTIASDIRRAMPSTSAKPDAMPPKLIICGPPAGGKGTQCEQLVKKYGVVHLSTGDMLRAAVKERTETGLKAKKYMDMGELVPDELIMDTILDRLSHPDCVDHGWLLDGFPRNEAQARSMVSFGILPDMVLVLDVPDEEVVERISGLLCGIPSFLTVALVGRRVDPATGKTFHVTFNPPPPELQDKVIQRSDDTEATVRIRLKSYHMNVNSVLKVFAPVASVVHFEGSGRPSADVTDDIFAAIDDARSRIDVEGNAFLMTLFCIDELYQVRSSDFLKFAFSLFPHKEYCVVTVSPLSPQPLVLSSFSLVHPKASSTYSQNLYLLHRDAIPFVSSAGNISIDVDRFHQAESFEQLAALVATLPPPSIAALEDEMALAADEDEIGLEDNPKHVLFVARIHGVVIALASFARHHEATNALKHYFDIEQFVVLNHHRAKDQALLTHWALNPIYACCGRFILKEMMRHFKKTCLFVSVPRQTHVSPLVAQEFALALPRRQIQPSPEDASKEENVEDAKRKVFANATLYFFTKRLLSEPKTLVNKRIVVVGASDTGLTLLKRLLNLPYARFTNLTLVSPHATNLHLPSTQVPPALPHFCRPSLLTAMDVSQFGIDLHVRTVVSRVVQIDRTAKAVVLVDNSCLPYDYLVLTTGLVDGTCKKLGLTSEYDGETYTPPTIPIGLHTLHDVATATQAHNAIKHLVATGTAPKVVISGTTAFALSVLQGVLALGVSSLSWLKGGGGGLLSISEDPRVNELLASLLQRNQVTILDNYEIESLVVSPRTGALESLQCLKADESQPTKTLVPCDVLLCCDQDDPDVDAFRAINDCGLVYDGRLVVNARFQTTDPFIYTGGSLCRFSRRFQSSLYQQFYSAVECGELLAASLLQVIDPVLSTSRPADGNDDAAAAAKKQLPPKFTMAKVTHSACMNGFHFVNINLPDMPLSLKSLTTESGDGTSYCCLQFDDFGTLARLTYLGSQAVEVTNLQCVVGLHEAYLNCALSSFHQNLISDWITFFRQPWANAVYHDRFQDFRLRLNAALKYDEGIRMLVEQVKRQAADSGDVKEAMALAQTQTGRGGSALVPTTKKMIELNLLDYLSAHRDVLNMYFLPQAQGHAAKKE